MNKIKNFEVPKSNVTNVTNPTTTDFLHYSHLTYKLQNSIIYSYHVNKLSFLIINYAQVEDNFSIYNKNFN